MNQSHYFKLLAFLLVAGITYPVSAQLRVQHNSSTTNPQLLLEENQNDYARISFQNTSAVSRRWVVGGLPSTSSGTAKLIFRYEDIGGAADRMTILGNGRVGIGNSNPDEELVVGSNLGSNWTRPALTVGNNNGGALEVGNSDYSIALEAATTIGAQILASTPSGIGNLAIFTGGMGVGVNGGAPGGYILRVAQSNLGLAMTSTNGDHDLEWFSGNTGNLQLYHNAVLIGTFNGSTGAYMENSDRRLKQGVKNLEKVLDRVLNLEVKRYRYKNGKESRQESIGFIAQKVEELFPEVVYQHEDDRNAGMYAINYAGFGPIAIKAIQELKEEVDEKDQRISELEDRLARIEKLLTTDPGTQNALIMATPPITPDQPVLEQNRPNPFESITTISYSIPEQAQKAQLRIADAQGKVLRTMDIEERGQIHTRLDAQALAAGTYYYSLWIDGELIGTRKMVLN